VNEETTSENNGWNMETNRAPSILHLPSSILLLLVAGCHQTYQEHLPTHPRIDPATTLAQLAQQADRLRTMSGSGTLELTQPKGQTVRLDMAVALQPPQRARIRAWKFGTAVFDLTVLPEGVWLESSKDAATPQQGIGATAVPVAKAWALLGGEFFKTPDLLTQTNGQWLVVRSVAVDQPTIICFVDRDTLTPRQYQIVDEFGKARFILTLDHYEDFAGIPWPRRIIASSDAGIISVDLTDVELNGDLQPLTFKPPRRAEKLP
jgi:outer membrane lipoprotein-sorting protein